MCIFSLEIAEIEVKYWLDYLFIIQYTKDIKI